ncbi:hypothetical protein LCGC14_3123920, partial [marine sediment metagenome]
MFEVAEYKVKFFHENCVSPYRWKEFFTEQPLARARTTCYIYRDNLKYLKADGTAWCSRKDQFNRNTGRKLALERALESAGFDKPKRTLFWEAYFKKRGKVG